MQNQRKNKISSRIANVLSIVPALFSLHVATRAEIKNFAFQGSVTRLENPSFVLDGSITNGSTFEGFYIFESTASDSNSASDVGDYRFNQSVFGVVVKVGNYVFRTNPRHVDFLIEVVNGPNDSYLIRSYQNICSQPLLLEAISWQLDDPTGTALADDSLPLTPPVLSAFQSAFGFTISGACDSFLIRGTVSSIMESPGVIPERPATTVGDAVQIQWPTKMGYFYQIQASSDLETWTDIDQPIMGDGTDLSKYVPRQPGKGVFYRAEISNFAN